MSVVRCVVVGVSLRDRVIDDAGLVHFADGTAMHMGTGHVYIKLLCGGTVSVSFEKTSKRIAPTCFGCLVYDAKLLRLYENLDRRGRHARRSNRR